MRLQYRRLSGDRCSLTASCLLNGASSSRKAASRLRGAGSVLGRLGGGVAAFGCLSARRGPPSVGRTGGPSWMTSGSTWQQCRAGRVMATRTAHCARRAPGFGGGRLYYSHAPSHRRYVDADFEGTILTALWEPASWSRPSRGRLLGAGPPAAFFMRAEVGPPSDSWPGDSRQGEGGPVSWILEGRIGS